MSIKAVFGAFLAFQCAFFAPIAQAQEAERMVLISTSYGDIKVKLYNDTPLHRDNFLKLAGEGYYDGTLFHRVIDGFMVQGGDPDSKGAARGVTLGNGGPGYTVPAEFKPNHVHIKGALCAARLGDQQNPTKASSGSQFYLVHGKPFTPDILARISSNRKQSMKRDMYFKFLKAPGNEAYLNRYKKIMAEKDQEALNVLEKEIEPLVDVQLAETMPDYTPEQLAAYEQIGGSPHLDGAYTVFGEVVEGLEVVDQIAKVGKDQMDRPLEDVKMTVKVLE